MRPSEVLARATDYLERHGVEDARSSAEILLARVLGTDRAGLFARADGLSTAEARSFGRALCQRCAGTPVQHLTGEQQFRHISLEMRPGVFVPRPETEIVVDAALRAIVGRAAPIVVDVGTGTGAIALSAKKERPDATVVATEVSPEAVSLARDNARRLALDVEVLEGDLLSPLPEGLAGELDLIVSNPPYVTEEEYEDLPAEVKKDPQLALLGGTSVHRTIAEAAAVWLRPGGSLVLEIGATQGAEVAAILRESFTEVRVQRDLSGRDRIVSAVRP